MPKSAHLALLTCLMVLFLQVGLKNKLKGIQQSFKWIERMDLTTGLAPVAPEMAIYVRTQFYNKIVLCTF